MATVFFPRVVSEKLSQTSVKTAPIIQQSVAFMNAKTAKNVDFG